MKDPSADQERRLDGKYRFRRQCPLVAKSSKWMRYPEGKQKQEPEKKSTQAAVRGGARGGERAGAARARAGERGRVKSARKGRGDLQRANEKQFSLG